MLALDLKPKCQGRFLSRFPPGFPKPWLAGKPCYACKAFRETLPLKNHPPLFLPQLMPVVELTTLRQEGHLRIGSKSVLQLVQYQQTGCLRSGSLRLKFSIRIVASPTKHQVDLADREKCRILVLHLHLLYPFQLEGHFGMRLSSSLILCRYYSIT